MLLTAQLALFVVLTSCAIVVRCTNTHLDIAIIKYYDLSRRMIDKGVARCCGTPSSMARSEGTCDASCANMLYICPPNYERDQANCDRSDKIGPFVTIPVRIQDANVSAMQSHAFGKTGSVPPYPYDADVHDKFFITMRMYDDRSKEIIAEFRFDETNVIAPGPYAYRALSYGSDKKMPSTTTHWLLVKWRVTCDENYHGVNCDVFCQPSDSDMTGHYTCDSNGTKVCNHGYEDFASNCVKVIDYCQSNPCPHGDTCVSHVGTFTCQGRLDPCESRPCQHQSTCISHAAYHNFSCQCSPDYTGSTCEIEFDPCTFYNAVCRYQINEMCVRDGDYYKCVCIKGYEFEYGFCTKSQGTTLTISAFVSFLCIGAVLLPLST